MNEAVAPVLEATTIARTFGPTVALDGVDLTLRAGEVHALIGENGAGKSTLMNIIAGAIRPDHGELRLAGRRYAPSSPHEARREGIALIHQELSLCPHLTVAENILLGNETARWGWIDVRAAQQRALAALEAFDHPEIRPDRRLAALPLAARQVVEICRALAANTRILLMDEPTSSLSRADVLRLFALIRQLAQSGIGVIYISHFLEEVREVADRFTVLRDGRSVATGELAGISDEQLIAHMVGRQMSGLFPDRDTRTAGDVVLAVEGLSSPPALRHASFELRRGEILGIAGLMGSGRTELVRALFGLDRVDAGSIVLRGQQTRARRAKPSARLASGIGYLSEDRTGEGLALPLSVADNLTLTRLSPYVRRGGWLDLRRQRDRARRLIDRLGIRARTSAQPVRTLSGGNQQKVSLGRLLHQNADILLLDEPTRGIDIGSKAQVYHTIARAADDGRAVLMVSSYLPELFGMADRIAVMSRGRLSAARPVSEWTPESVLAAAIGSSEPP
jgi:ribose transport system ATP-binding protein